MQIIEKRLDEIRPYENNPRHNDEAVEYVANSLREFGWKQPIVIDRDGVIVAGHTRYAAAKKLGMKTAPCVIADDLTPEQVKAYRLADNKTGEVASWDFEALEVELDGIEMDMEQFGFEIEEEPPEVTEPQGGEKASLAEKYLVPPFSVIYANKPDWLARKRAWVEKGIKSELGRGGTCLQYKERQPVRGVTESGGVQEQRQVERVYAKAYADGLIAKREEIRKYGRIVSK